MSMEEVSKVEHIMRRIEVYIGSGMPLTLEAAKTVRVLLGKKQRKEEETAFEWIERKMNLVLPGLKENQL